MTVIDSIEVQLERITDVAVHPIHTIADRLSYEKGDCLTLFNFADAIRRD